MANDIQGIGSRLPATVRSTTDRDGQQAPTRGGGAPDDRVSITETAINLGNLERTMAQIPVVDAGRVESVREALAEGTYTVDPERTADRFIQFEMQLNFGAPAYARY